MAAVHCTECGTTLAVHCDSRQCHWYRCDNRRCPWWVYDLNNGSRSTLEGRVERLTKPRECTKDCGPDCRDCSG